MNARRKIESVLADIFGQYITDFKVLAGRGDGVVTDPFFCVEAEEVVETVRGSGVYLGDVHFVVITESNKELTADQDARIGECMDLVRKLSNTLCSGNSCIVDTTLKIVVDGIAQLSQAQADDEQSFGDMVSMRVGFRETDNVIAVAPAPNMPRSIPPWWGPPVMATQGQTGRTIPPG